MKIVFLDAETIGSDIDLSEFHELGSFICYDHSLPEEVPERVKDAQIVLTNKVQINEKTIGAASDIQLICETATGINNLDTEYLAARGIPWKNAAGYSTEAVCQHTFAMLLYLLERLPYYENYVKSGAYAQSTSFTHFAESFSEISGKTWGIIGLGTIGRRVAAVAAAFGARVIYYSPSGRAAQPGYTQVNFDTLLSESDFITIHTPLNQYTLNLINKEAFRKMKTSCILINAGRGGIVNEEDLYEALTEGEIAACGLDVLETEPMKADHPLLQIKDSRKLLITPHMAWASIEARARLMDITKEHIKEFLELQ